jgi:hypothetical protein
MAAHAATLNVGPGQPYTTIQSAIDASTNGDTIVVAPGTYYENIDFKGKAITVTSGATSYLGSSGTIIDGGKGIGFAVTFQGNETAASVINGFTIQNATGGKSSNVFLSSGGVGVINGTPTISNNTFTHNLCNAIYSEGSPLIVGNEIDNTLDIQGHCTFGAGSAIWLEGSLVSPNARVVGNLIQNNTQSSHEDAGGNGGSGVAVWGAYAYIAGNTIRNNITTGDGGAILAFNTDNVIVIGNLIYGNQAQTDGAISLQPPSASVGPFIGIIASNTIYGNAQNATKGGLYGDAPSTQVYLDANLGQYILINNIIYGGGAGTAAVSCGTVYNYLSITPLVFDHNDLYNPGGTNYGGACADQTGTYGNISADPKFVNASGGNFQLTPGSPAVDTGNNSAPDMTTFDLLNAPRIQDATGLGYPVVDMGAYELTGRGFPSPGELAPTFLTLTPSTYTPFSYGNNSPFTLTATAISASGTPMGAITFFEDSQNIGTVNLNASGVATLQPPVPMPGLHAFTATYPGQGPFSPAVSVKFYVLFPKYTPTLTLTSSSNPSQLNTPVTFTATIASADNTVLTPITLTDTTTNTVLATVTPNSAGVATFTTSSLAAGSHYITATYAGDATHNSASASVFQNVVNGYATGTFLNCTPNPIAINATSLCTVRVTSSNGTPTGSVTLTDGNTTLATLPLTAGSATYTYTGTSAGIHNLTASYPVTGTFNASSASFSLNVNGLPTTTTASVSPDPSTYGQPTIFTVHVAPISPNSAVPSGTVILNFCHGAIITLTLDATGSASVTTPIPGSLPEPVGSCPFTATYQGDTTFNASTSASVGYVVNPAPSTTTIVASPSPAYALTPVTITVTVAANPSPTFSSTGQIIPAVPTVATGTVSLLDGTTFLAKATLVNGQAVFTVTTLAVGQHTLTANFAPDFNLNASSANTTATILANTTATTLTASPNPGVQSQQITLTASAADTTSSVVPLGSVQFFNGTTLLGTVQLSATGTATLTTSFSAGQQSITAVYVPSSTAFLPSTSTLLPLPIASQDFTFTTTTPSITIQTQHHSSLQLTLTSIGGFTGPVALGCGAPLPIYLTCELPPNAINLTANATLPITLTLDTDEVLNFLAANQPPTRTNTANRIAFALLLPFAALPFAARRRKLRHLLSLLCIAVICSAVTACTGYYPPSTPPGTYTIPLTATGTSSAFSTTPITHTLNITFTVTP